MKSKNNEVFSSKVNEIKEQIRDVYESRKRPVIVGFSGGKDSTMTLQIVLEALLETGKGLKYPIHVISTDTLVETPFFISHVNNSIKLINQMAKDKGLEDKLIAHKLTPEYKNSFWVNLIGRGYPAPSQTFRWCTDRMKIKPVNAFVKNQVNDDTDVTIIIGARKDESISRKQLMENYEKNSSDLGLSQHDTLAGAWVFSPISELTTSEVWLYLTMNPNPWGADNNMLMEMYQQGSGEDSKECPTVIDDKTESCGSSRFGCWVCTVVQKDTSMENVSQQEGNEWMKELLNFRNMLKETIDIAKKSEYRSHKRRNGHVSIVRDLSRIAYGPYKIEYRKKFLLDLLKAQKKINDMGQDIKLIQDEELSLIRDIWIDENFDWEDSVSLSLEKVGYKLNFDKKYDLVFNEDDKKLLLKVCEEEDVDSALIGRILNTEILNNQPSQRGKVFKDINKVFKEEWRKEEEILKLLDQEERN
tara:strand:- start:9211 stop:10629 length:1419 start_codon:yes stop_codon:yes gene_type:complete